MGIFLLWATWTHKYMAIFFKVTGIARRGVLREYVILTKLGQHVNEIMAVAVKTFSYNQTKR